MPAHKVEPKEKVCPVCKSIFLVGGRGRRPCKTNFCSRLCMNKAKYHKGAKCNQLREKDAAYIAGFADGEGTILIIHRKPNSYYIGFRIAQSARARRVLDWISEVTGIGTSINKNPSKGKNHDLGLTWACSGEAAISLLVQLLPFQIVKQKQIELAVDFQNRLRQPNLKADRTWQAEYKEKMGTLNKRGR